jgi:hypothetical protein
VFARRPCRAGTTRCALALALGVSTLALAACGDTLQDQPIPHNELEGLIMSEYPVFWLGRSFEGMQITEAGHDPSDAYSVQYGDCLEGGQGTCTPPVRVVTSPDNSFVPGEPALHGSGHIRGIAALVAQDGRTIEIPTGGVVVGIYASSAPLASAAAKTVVPINAIGSPGGTLPAPLPDTGFAETPLPGQMPPPLRELG